MSLIPNVLDNRPHVPSAYRAYKVSIRPKAITPYSLCIIWVQFSQLLTRSTFNQLHHLRWRIRRLTGQNQVYVIRLYVQLNNLKAVYLRTKTNHTVQTFLDIPYQFSSPILWDERKVIGDIVACVTGIFDFHIPSLASLQPFVFVLKRIPFLPVLIGRGFLE